MHLNGNVDAEFLKPLGRHGSFLEVDECCCFRSTASTSLILPMWDWKGCVWSPLTEQPAHFHGCRYTWASTTVFRAVGPLWLISVTSPLPATWGLNVSESWFFGGLPISSTSWPYHTKWWRPGSTDFRYFKFMLVTLTFSLSLSLNVAIVLVDKQCGLLCL